MTNEIIPGPKLHVARRPYTAKMSELAKKRFEEEQEERQRNQREEQCRK